VAAGKLDLPAFGSPTSAAWAQAGKPGALLAVCHGDIAGPRAWLKSPTRRPRRMRPTRQLRRWTATVPAVKWLAR